MASPVLLAGGVEAGLDVHEKAAVPDRSLVNTTGPTGANEVLPVTVAV